VTLEEQRDALLVEVKLVVSILGERNWLDVAWQRDNTPTTP